MSMAAVRCKYFLGSWFLGPMITLILAATREEKGQALRQVDLWKRT
jgi:hypothetical protein